MNNELQKVLQQKGMTVLPDTPTWINRFEIESASSDRIYVIAQRANLSEWGCSCMAWKRYRHCKHLNAVLPLLKNA